MLIHLFDGASSPSCANYTLKKTAEVNKNDFDSVTVETINVTWMIVLNQSQQIQRLFN